MCLICFLSNVFASLRDEVMLDMICSICSLRACLVGWRGEVLVLRGELSVVFNEFVDVRGERFEFFGEGAGF